MTKETGCTKTSEYIHTVEYYLVIKRTEVLVYATTWMNHENIMLSEGSQLRKETFYDTIYMKCSEQENPDRHKVNFWLPRAGGEVGGVEGNRV